MYRLTWLFGRGVQSESTLYFSWIEFYHTLAVSWISMFPVLGTIKNESKVFSHNWTANFPKMHIFHANYQIWLTNYQKHMHILHMYICTYICMQFYHTGCEKWKTGKGTHLCNYTKVNVGNILMCLLALFSLISVNI